MADNTKVIALWSPTAGAGTTFTACNLARLMAAQGHRVCLLDFDLKSPAVTRYFPTNDTTHCLDAVLPYTEAGPLGVDALEVNLQVLEGVHVLRGALDPSQAPFVKQEALERVLDTTRTAFDYVVIDTNPDFFDNAGSYVALTRADRVYLVMTKNVITGMAFKQIESLLLGAVGSLDKFVLLVNQTQKDVYMETEELRGFIGVSRALELPSLGAPLINALNQGKWLEHLSSSDKIVQAYLKAVGDLVEHITGEEVEDTTGKKRRFSLFGRGRG